jgi:hypothetical protein
MCAEALQLYAATVPCGWRSAHPLQTVPAVVATANLKPLHPCSCSHMEYCLLADTLTTAEAIFAKMIMTHYTLRESKVRHTAWLTKIKGGGGKDRDGKSNHFDGPVVSRQYITLTNIILQGGNGTSKYTLQPGMGISGG